MKGDALLEFDGGDVVQFRTQSRTFEGVVHDVDSVEHNDGSARVKVEVGDPRKDSNVLLESDRADHVSDWSGITAHFPDGRAQTVEHVSLA